MSIREFLKSLFYRKPLWFYPQAHLFIRLRPLVLVLAIAAFFINNIYIQLFCWLLALLNFAVWFYGMFHPRSGIFGPVITKGLSDSVTLTFDDGPDPVCTPMILDILDRYNTKAIFFVVGYNARKYPELIKEILDRGHEIGCHSDQHHALFVLYSYEQKKRELERCLAELRALGVENLRYFRPPAGITHPDVFAIAASLGMQIVGWSSRAFDTSCHNPRLIAQRIMKSLTPGAIILLHDGSLAAPGKQIATVQALPEILEGLKAKGLGMGKGVV